MTQGAQPGAQRQPRGVARGGSGREVHMYTHGHFTLLYGRTLSSTTLSSNSFPILKKVALTPPVVTWPQPSYFFSLSMTLPMLLEDLSTSCLGWDSDTLEHFMFVEKVKWPLWHGWFLQDLPPPRREVSSVLPVSSLNVPCPAWESHATNFFDKILIGDWPLFN